MEESGTKLHTPLVLNHFVLFPQKLSECGRVITIFVQINKHLSAPKKNIAESVKGKKEYPFLLKEDKKRMSSHEFTLEE